MIIERLKLSNRLDNLQQVKMRIIGHCADCNNFFIDEEKPINLINKNSNQKPKDNR